MTTMPINQLPTPIQVPSMSACAVGSVPAPPVPAPPVPGPQSVPVAPITQVAPTLPIVESSARLSTIGPRVRLSPRSGRIAGIAAAVILVIGVGAAAASALGGADGGGSTGGGNRGNGGSAGNASISNQELAGAYGSEFGVAPSDETLACVADELSSDVAPSVRALMSGQSLGFDETRAAVLPFTACAPDEDFAVNMIAASVILVPGADEACISDVVLESDAGSRADALALSLVDPQQFANRLYNTVVGCA